MFFFLYIVLQQNEYPFANYRDRETTNEILSWHWDKIKVVGEVSVWESPSREISTKRRIVRRARRSHRWVLIDGRTNSMGTNSVSAFFRIPRDGYSHGGFSARVTPRWCRPVKASDARHDATIAIGLCRAPPGPFRSYRGGHGAYIPVANIFLSSGDSVCRRGRTGHSHGHQTEQHGIACVWTHRLPLCPGSATLRPAVRTATRFANERKWHLSRKVFLIRRFLRCSSPKMLHSRLASFVY